MQNISDSDDPRLADYRHLNDAAIRTAAGHDSASGCAIVEGAVALDVVVGAGVALRSILLLPSRAATLSALLSRVPTDVPVYVVEPDVLTEVVGFDLHRGVLASAVRPPGRPAAELLASCRRVVLSQGLNDHENIGALFRNAAAFGFDAVLLDDRTADPLYRRSIRVSSGWAAALPHARLGTLPDGYDVVRRAGFRIVALTPAADATVLDAASRSGLLDDRVAVVVGAEGPGLTAEAMHEADHAVRIPMAPGVDSLNVATSLAVVGAFAASRRGWDP